MLACFDCHSRIDRNGKRNEYTGDQLQAMKREHEARMELIYSATGVKDSLPILMSFPVGVHVPVIELAQIHHAMLENSSYTRFPVDKHIYIDKGDFDIQDDSPDFWARAERVVADLYDRRIHPEIIAKEWHGASDHRRARADSNADEVGCLARGQDRGARA